MGKTLSTFRMNNHTIRATIEITIDGKRFPFSGITRETSLSDRQLRRILFGEESITEEQEEEIEKCLIDSGRY